MDLFTQLETHFAPLEPDAKDEEAFVLVCGGKGCGKSSLIASLSPALSGGSPRPTVGLEYSFLRFPRGGGGDTSAAAAAAAAAAPTRCVAHVWEVGGACWAPAAGEWLTVPLTPQRLPAAVLLLLLDCSKPLELCAAAAAAYGAVRRRVEECCEKLARAAAAGAPRAGSAGAPPPPGGAPPPPPPLPHPDALHAAAAARLRLGFAQRGGERAGAPPHEARSAEGAARALAELPPHPDGGALGLPPAHTCVLPLPVVVVATKWDALRDAGAPARGAALTALRAVALATGGALVAASATERGGGAAVRAALAAAAFGGEGRRGRCVDVGAGAPAPAVPAGADAAADVAAAGAPLGLPPGAAHALLRGGLPLDARLEAFSALLKAHFGGGGGGAAAAAAGAAGEGGEEEEEEEGDLATLFPEPAVDAIVAAQAAQAEAARAAREREKRLAASEARAAAAAKAV
jgi:hypothetical protein